MSQPSVIESKEQREIEELQLDPLDSLVFPRDSPDYWRGLEDQDRWASSMIRSLEEQIKVFGESDFKTVNTSHFDEYHKFIAKNTSAIEAIPALEDCCKALKSLNELRMKLTAGFQKWESLTRKNADELKEFQAKEEELLKQKAAYVGKLKAYLTEKVPKKGAEKEVLKTQKMRSRKQGLAKQRVEVLCHFRKLQIEKESAVLSPLFECLSAYSEFFKAGHALISPLRDAIARLGEFTKKRQEESQGEEKKLVQLRSDWEKLATPPEVSAEASAAYAGASGIHDLDGLRVAKSTEVRKKEGYLFIQQPQCQRVWCSVDGEYFNILHSLTVDDDIAIGKLEGLLSARKRKEAPSSDTKMLLQICTVKESPDSLFRYSFQIIAPQSKMPLQADSLEDMKDWIQVIRNAIGFGLAGGGRRDPPPLAASFAGGGGGGGPVSSGSGAGGAGAGGPAGASGGSATPTSSGGSSGGVASIGAAAAAGGGGGGGIPAGFGGGGGARDSKISSSAPSSPLPVGAMGGMEGEAPEAELQQQQKELREVKGNDMCADCNGKNPEWVSLNLGIMVCVTCSGIHRSLGVHISKVRSCVLDKLDRFAMGTLKCIGNDNALDVWESKLTSSDKLKKSHKPNISSKNWIRAKYVQKSFVQELKADDPMFDPQKALFVAITQLQPLEVLKAIARNADPNKPNPEEDGRTAVHQAVMYGDPRSLDLLVLNGGELTIQEQRGWSPLHYAAYQDDPELCELILLRGGSKLATITCKEGYTPLEASKIYCESGIPKCVPVLEKALAYSAAKAAAAAAAAGGPGGGAGAPAAAGSPLP